MTDLSAKFTSLEDQLHTQHEALMDALSGIGDQLAAIAVALAPAPPPTVTLEDVIAAIRDGNAISTDGLARLTAIADSTDAINTTVGDIHLDTMSMDQKLLTMRDTLGNIHLDTMSMDQKLLKMRDDLADLLLEAMNITSATRGTHDRLVDVLAALALLHDAFGAPTGDATSTMLGFLSSIAFSNAKLVDGQQELIKCACPGNPEGCDHPYSSGDMWLAPFGLFGFDGVMVATWPTAPPEGIEYGTIFGITQDNTELYSADWSGWSVYVESSEPQYAQNLGSDRFPTRTWRNMPAGEGSYTFSVNQKGALRVTLCAPDAPPAPEGETGGWSGVGQRLHHTGPSTFQSQSPLIIGGYSENVLNPNPNMSLGSTLYFHNCYNHTRNADKNLYLAMDEDDEGSVFLTVPPGETVPWVVNTSESFIFVYTWSLPEDDPGHGFLINFAWTPAEAEAHCYADPDEAT